MRLAQRSAGDRAPCQGSHGASQADSRVAARASRARHARWHFGRLHRAELGCRIVRRYAQQRTATPLIEGARRRGVSVAGWVDGRGDPRAAIAEAKSAGLAAVAVESSPDDADFPVISYGKRASVPRDSVLEAEVPAAGRGGPVSGTMPLAQALSHRGRRGRKRDFPDAERLGKRLVAQELVLRFVPDGEHVFGARGCVESTS